MTQKGRRNARGFLAAKIRATDAALGGAAISAANRLAKAAAKRANSFLGLCGTAVRAIDPRTAANAGILAVYRIGEVANLISTTIRSSTRLVSGEIAGNRSAAVLGPAKNAI